MFLKQGETSETDETLKRDETSETPETRETPGTRGPAGRFVILDLRFEICIFAV